MKIMHANLQKIPSHNKQIGNTLCGTHVKLYNLDYDNHGKENSTKLKYWM